MEKEAAGVSSYGVLIGKMVARLIIVGLFTRPALVLAFTMIVAWLMVGTGKTLHSMPLVRGPLSTVYFFIRLAGGSV